MFYIRLFIILISFIAILPAYAEPLRLGYMPNITHAQALVIMEKEDTSNIKTIVFNSGPAIIDAIFTDRIDMAYIGSNPAINGYIRSKGKALVIVAGATSGGAVLVMRDGTTLGDDSKLATPSIGNTQDVALRYYLKENNIKAEVISIPNKEIFQLFKAKKIDGAWVPEPWGTIIKNEGGYIAIDERDLWDDGTFPAAVLIVSKKYLANHRDEVEDFLKLHIKATEWINAHPDEAKEAISKHIQKLSKKKMNKKVLDESFSRISATYDPMVKSLNISAQHAYTLGYLGANPDGISQIYDLSLLNELTKDNKGAEK